MKKYLFLNWKNYLSLNEAHALTQQLSNFKVDKSQVELVAFPTIAALTDIQSYGVPCGIQYFDEHEAGAYTGETTFNLVEELGVSYALVGHSERRIHFGETNEQVAVKVKLLLEAGVTPVICVGENAEQRESGQTKDIVSEQIKTAIQDIDVSKVMIAYEPVWAISSFGGTKAAEYEDVQEMHQFISEFIDGQAAGVSVTLLYGGSVKSDIDDQFLKSDVIHGFLVGSASTKFEEVQKLYSRLLES